MSRDFLKNVLRALIIHNRRFSMECFLENYFEHTHLGEIIFYAKIFKVFMHLSIHFFCVYST